MTYPDASRMPEYAAAWLVAISQWIDAAPANAARDREAAAWGRISKIGEEFGEVISEFIALTGQNPRKPQDGDALPRVKKELLDVALTALAAYEHLDSHQGLSIQALFDHIEFVRDRMNPFKNLTGAEPLAATHMDESHVFHRSDNVLFSAGQMPVAHEQVISATNAWDSDGITDPSDREKFRRMYLNAPPEPPRPACPTCGSPEPRLHPATTPGEGPRRICPDPYHGE